MFIRFKSWCAATAAVLLTGCPGSAPTLLDGGSPGEQDGGLTQIPIAWSPCELTPGQPGAECALVEVPLRYEQLDAGSIQVGLKRVVPASSPKAQVWLVEGGPGGSGVNALAANARSLLTARDDIELYAIDHRGVGGSVPLDCPIEESASSEWGEAISEAEWPACLDHLMSSLGDSLNALTTANSARDLGTVIERVRKPGVSVFVYGISYGSYETLTYLKLFPQQPTGVILEGINPLRRHFELYDAQMNDTAKELMALCAQDSECSARLGADPWTTAASVVESFDSGHCPMLGLDSDGARAFLGSYLAVAPVRDYIPILVYRMRRCAANDVDAIAKFYQTLATLGLSFNDGKAVTLPAFFHVALSEMWHREGLPNPTDVTQAWRQTVMSTGLSVAIAQRQSAWPVYPRESADVSLPEYGGPLLMVHGRLDAAASIASAAELRDFYRAPNQTWAEFPYGAHAVYGTTPIADGNDCGERLVFQFIDHPTEPLDTSCLSQTLSPGFSGSAALNQKLLGVSTGWD
jgi:pimeloyl-ACP methyl ester carboxylesterase